MRAGSLDRSNTIERRADVVGEGGRVETTWTTVATRRAELLEDTASATTGGAGELTKAALRFRIRYLADLGFDDRVVFNGEAFEIAAVAEIGRRKALEIELARIGDARP